jgi:hypothetical protein
MKAFVSYRRSDTRDFAGRFADRLKRYPQVSDVFMDIDAIAPGADFERGIADAVSRCDVFFAVIGPQWLGSDPQASRILDEKDFVRRELQMALATGRKVVPVLVNDAEMPSVEALPSEIQSLPRINAFTIGHVSFDRDVAALLSSLGVRDTLAKSPLALLMRGAIGAGIGLALLLAVAAIHQALSGMSLNTRLGSDGLVWLIIVGVVALSTVAAIRR